MFQLVHDTVLIALSATDPSSSVEDRAVAVGSELAAVTALQPSMCSSAVFSALLTDSSSAAALRVARTLTSPLRV